MADTSGVIPPSPTAEKVLSRSAHAAVEGEQARDEDVRPLHSFRYRDFRILWLGNTLSAAANWFQVTAVGWVVYDLTGSGSILGAVTGVRAIPQILLTPLAGVAADRLDRRGVMFVSQSALVLGTLAVAMALVFHRLEVWHLFAYSILWGAGITFNQPARQAAILDVVPKPAIPNAVALGNVGQSLMRVLGPGAGGLLLAAFGGLGNFAVQAALLAGGAATVIPLRLPARRVRAQAQSAIRDMWDGLAYVTKDRRIFLLMVMSVISAFFMWPFWNALMPIFAKDAVHVGPRGLGVLLSSIGVGGILGAAAVASLNRFDRRGTMQTVGLVVQALAMLGFALSPSIYVAAPLLALGGFAEAFYMLTNQTLIQLLAPEHMRGRVASFMQLPMLIFPVGIAIGGVLADVFGIRATAAVSISIALTIALFFLVASPTIRSIRLSDITRRSEGS